MCKSTDQSTAYSFKHETKKHRQRFKRHRLTFEIKPNRTSRVSVQSPIGQFNSTQPTIDALIKSLQIVMMLFRCYLLQPGPTSSIFLRRRRHCHDTLAVGDSRKVHHHDLYKVTVTDIYFVHNLYHDLIHSILMIFDLSFKSESVKS